ncbi:septum formation initiator family protein [Micromonospora sp. WMMD1082]|uniref:septum formation initiator family protein n=1 Tax=Micromonospora sp. WMMD1082 TaxID=3016104 RepID=UPI002415C075|nr:septum formation initiator family protein [Micromonospora sp. WMMD1082]MDG4796562.1 septum formation initiator family protein [Micromonospora sp. WMMD1082]
MNVDKRRDIAGAGQRAPRSGGRIAAERVRGAGDARRADRAGRPAETRARGAREFPTQGSAALRPVERAAAERAESPRLRVAPPPPVRVPRAPFAALVVVLVVGGVLGILAVNTKINENAFRLDELQQQQAKLDVEQQQLKKQIAESESPGNLAAQARKLGLVESGELGLIRLPDGKLIGVPQPAVGQPSIASQGGQG